MAYVDHAFSITDEDIMMDNSYAINNKPPIKEIALAVSLLVFGVVGIVLGIFMAVNHIGGDRAHVSSVGGRRRSEGGGGRLANRRQQSQHYSKTKSLKA
uniref:Uncharacterized protein n=1 Tax=Chenopodium quinoa TaxID=63459 RepID=A0A803MD99_CHEQI